MRENAFIMPVCLLNIYYPFPGRNVVEVVFCYLTPQVLVHVKNPKYSLGMGIYFATLYKHVSRVMLPNGCQYYLRDNNLFYYHRWLTG